MIEADGVALCVHNPRLKKDRPTLPSAAPVMKDEENKEEDPVTQEEQDDDLVVGVTKDEENKEEDPVTQDMHDNDFVVGVTKDEDEEASPATQEVENNDFMVDATKHEEKKEADPATHKVQDNDFVVGADPGNTNIITIAAPKRAEDGTDGNLRQKDMRLLRFSRARYYRESGIINARKKIETWNSGMKEHLEASSEVTSRGADFEAFRKFTEVRVAHWEAP
jgi:hypothetical protein